MTRRQDCNLSIIAPPPLFSPLRLRSLDIENKHFVRLIFFPAGRDSSGNAKDVDKAKLVRDRQNEERQRKLEELRQQALAAQRFRVKREVERRRRIDELKSRDSERYIQKIQSPFLQNPLVVKILKIRRKILKLIFLNEKKKWKIYSQSWNSARTHKISLAFGITGEIKWRRGNVWYGRPREKDERRYCGRIKNERPA